MRNLNECQAEVFRRSEKRIKARKKRRNHVLMTCVPLALCVSVLAVFVLSGGKRSAPESIDPTVIPLQNEIVQSSTMKIEVSGQGRTKAYTDPEVVMTVYTQLYGYYCASTEDSMGTGAAGGNEFTGKHGITSEVTSSPAGRNGYQIVITLENGSKLSFDLDGMVLTVRNTNRSYTLTHYQYKVLTEILDIG